ncbi:hypothetical protein ACRAWC_00370 [Leifsonia sp. L25]|uniref:hypothetical protein n=1 Tax=Leifsonia sp. L25 TaxID=3423957 RepID=UPI003D69109B
MRASIVTDPPGASWTGLKPGDHVTASLTVTNTFAYPVELSGVVSREGVLTVGAHPLQVGFDIVRSTDAGGGTTGACPLRADALPADTHARVLVDVTFPQAAGNEYQNASGQATLFLTATQITPEECGGTVAAPPAGRGPGGLAETGLDLSPTLLVAVVVALAGWAIRAAGRRRRGRTAS